MANNSSSIVHGAKIPMVIVRHNLVWVCEQAAIGHACFPLKKKDSAANRTLVLCSAALLNNFIYWHDHRVTHNRLARQENIMHVAGNKSEPHSITDWIFLTISDLQASVFNQWGETKIVLAKSVLVKAGFILERPNGINSWDKTMRYCLAPDKLQKACNLYIAEFKDRPEPEPTKPVPPQTSEEKEAHKLAVSYISTWQSMFKVVNGKSVYGEHMKIATGLAKTLKQPNKKFAEYLSFLQKQEHRTTTPKWDYLGQNFGTWLSKQNGATNAKPATEKTKQTTGLGSKANMDKLVDDLHK